MKKPAGETFPQIEEKVLAFWKATDIFAKSLEQRKEAPRFTFYDGPPFATGLPHYGHILQMTIKDVVTRYKTMRGYFVPRRNGWDCHGLPVEYELEKELGIKTKADIEKLGVDVFNKKAREIVLRYTSEWTKTMERMGRWIDTENAYTSMSNDYIESVWWVFKQIWDKGYVYQDYRVSPYCPRCGTALANFEVTQGYKEVGDESLYLRFKAKVSSKVKSQKSKPQGKTPNRDIIEEETYFLVWTTTPWTLPGNVALAISRDIAYCKVKIKKEKVKSNEYLILAKDRLGVVKDDYEIVEEFIGSELQGTEYEELYPQAAGLLKEEVEKKKLYKVQLADFVSTEEGTGIVHIAPAFGEDDMTLAREKDLPLLTTVDLSGSIISGLDLPGQGRFAKQADADIKDDLRERGLLYKEEKITHAYPFCWRCESPLLYYALPSWYVAVTKARDELVKNNQQINWVPKHVKDGRFGNWLEGARDWAISRSRYWGAPIPVWVCEECNEKRAIGSKQELNLEEDFDLHKPQIDEVILKCEKCSGKMKRVAEVFDCWFESGSMPYAQWHYPFENKEEFENSFPADFIAEALEQTRGWFYTLHVLSTLLFDKPAYKNVIASGLILAQDGRKLSKRLRNYVEPTQIFDTIGVDALRYFLMASTPIGEDYRFSDTAVREQVRKYILPIWNSYNYLATYAPLAKWEPEQEGDLTLLDRWMESRLQAAIKEVAQWMDRYELTKAARVLGDVVSDLSNWYIRRSRKRQDAAFFATLYRTLKTLAILTAPFTPFVAEELYQNLKSEKDKESVHLVDYPVPEDTKIDNELLNQMEAARAVVEMGHALRAESGIKVRQPLGKIAIDTGKLTLPKDLIDIILDELNIKQATQDVEAASKMQDVVKKSEKGMMVVLDTTITPELRREGVLRELIRQIQDLRKEAGYKPGEQVTLSYTTESQELNSLVEDARESLEKETYTTVKRGLDEATDTQKKFNVAGQSVEIGVKRVE